MSGSIGGATLLVVEVVHDHADGKAEGAIREGSSFSVAAGEISVYGDDRAPPRPSQRRLNAGPDGARGFAFAAFSFGDFRRAGHAALNCPHRKWRMLRSGDRLRGTDGEGRNDGSSTALRMDFTEGRFRGARVLSSN